MWTVVVLVLVAACGGHNATAPAPPPPAATSPRPAPAAVGANELGSIPILMYHQLSPTPTGDYDQTPEKFRGELDRLYRENYRPVTITQYLSGNLDLPAGTHPVVLTFDDSTTSQVRFTDTGALDPNCAVGILQDFAATHQGFAPVATFYVNDNPFAGDPRALPWLASHGFEIGDHTADHRNLSALGAAGVQREIGENLRTITAAAPGITVRTLALPDGAEPENPALATKGTWEGTPYSFDGVLLVGANPAPAPFGRLDPTSIPRIRSGRTPVQFDSIYWLDHLAAHPDQRYTSDGDPDHISFPRTLSADLNPRWASRSNPY